MNRRSLFGGIGIYVYGLASVATGLVDVMYARFASAEEPIQAFGARPHWEPVFAEVVGVLLILGGVAVLVPRFAQRGAVLLAIMYAIFAVFWLPRLVTAPAILGYRPSVYIGVLDGVCQQLILICAAVFVCVASAADGSRAVRDLALVARWLVGLSAVNFGLAHFTGPASVTRLIPAWLPPNATFWAILTGICFVLAGIGIVTGVRSILAARLLGAMLLVFSALALAPLIVAYPHAQNAWGVNTYNLAAVGACWVLADYLALHTASAKV